MLRLCKICDDEINCNQLYGTQIFEPTVAKTKSGREIGIDLNQESYWKNVNTQDT